MVSPIPSSIDYDLEKSNLGKKLFFDSRLSKDSTISCVSCHDIYRSGDDGLKVAVGINGKEGIVNTPTVFNAVFNFAQNWDGSAKNLKEQAKGPITNPVEMGHNFDDLISELSKDKNYQEEFKKLYNKKISKELILDALFEFQKTLITPNAPFDRYLRGDENAITPTQKEGYELFKSKGCIACHNGINLGGQLFAKFGMVGLIDDKNLGLYNITKDEEDKYYFKVPTLRNISKTAPYFHTGSVDTLYEAVEIMLYYQVGRETSESEIEKIVEFLNSLDGELPYGE